MSGLLSVAAVLACGLGAALRYRVSRLDTTGAFPWPTIVSNTVGSAVLGGVVAAVTVGGADAGWLLVVGGGFAGGLTTFSTLAVDAFVLWREDRRAAFASYLAATFATGLLGAAAGWYGWEMLVA